MPGFVKGMQAKSVGKLLKPRKKIPDPLLVEITKDFKAWFEGLRKMYGGFPLSMLSDAEFWERFGEYIEFAKAEVENERYIALMEKLMSAAITGLEIRELRKILVGAAETTEGVKMTLRESLDSAEKKLKER